MTSVTQSEGSYIQVVDDIRAWAVKFLGHPYSRIVFTNGCFDLLHLGHLDVLARCRELAGPHGAVVVGLNSDASVSRLKGEGRPVVDVATRGTLLASLKTVDHVVVFDEETPRQLIDVLRPDVIVKGGDYKSDEVVGADISSVVIVPRNRVVSTSAILQKLRRLP